VYTGLDGYVGILTCMCLTHEPHYNAKQLATIWGVSPQTIRNVIENEEGVLLIGEPSRRVGKKLKRSYMTMRIPYSVAERVHRERSTSKR
jgi:hypothetical protein